MNCSPAVEVEAVRTVLVTALGRYLPRHISAPSLVATDRMHLKRKLKDIGATFDDTYHDRIGQCKNARIYLRIPTNLEWDTDALKARFIQGQKPEGDNGLIYFEDEPGSFGTVVRTNLKNRPETLEA